MFDAVSIVSNAVRGAIATYLQRLIYGRDLREAFNMTPIQQTPLRDAILPECSIVPGADNIPINATAPDSAARRKDAGAIMKCRKLAGATVPPGRRGA